MLFGFDGQRRVLACWDYGALKECFLTVLGDDNDDAVGVC